MVNFFPELATIIGPQRAVQELDPNSTVARLLDTFVNFVKCIATSQHKVKFFILYFLNF